MASIAASCRLSARIATRNVRHKAAYREFSGSSPRWAAQNFVMPAMSPTMTEGNIASWKVKEGDSFSAGDVLLEIETDKAQMDVEAQDDGIMAKIMQQDGSKSVKVGTRIAVLADPGDDVSTIEIPADEAPSNAPAAKEASEEPKRASSGSSQKEAPPKTEEKTETPSSSSYSSPQAKSSSETKHIAPNQNYPLYPSVQHLLHTQGLSSEDVSKMSATGPSGRLLKGDVLAYIGSVDKSYAAELSQRLEKLSHLDLSNIKKAQPKPPSEKEAKKDAPSKLIEESLELDTEVALPISLAAVFSTQRRIKESLGLTLPLSTFIARASEIANENLPKAKGTAASADELFDAVLGLDAVKPRGTRGRYSPQITALPPPLNPAGPRPVLPRIEKPVDVIDFLSGTKPKPALPTSLATPAAIGVASGAAGANNLFSVVVGKGEEKRARVYLERVKTVLEAEPGRCVL